MKKAMLFACIEKNIGDDLFVYLVCKRYKNVDFYISDEAKYGSLEKISNLHFSKLIRIWTTLTKVSKNNIVKYWIARTVCIIIGLFIPKYEYGVYIVGNAFKNTNYRDSSQISWLIHRIKKVNRFYILSTNFGPYKSNKWVADCKKVFAMAEDVCFRDNKSFELFSNQLGNVRYAPDAVLSLGIQKKHDPKLNHKKRVLITVVRYPNGSLDDKKRYIDRLASIVTYFIDLSISVSILNSNADQDMTVTSEVIKKVKSSKGIDIINYDGNLEKIKELYNSTDYVIGTRLHTIILAWLYNIPVFPIVYDVKVANIINDYGFSSGKCSIEDFCYLKNEDIYASLMNYDFQLSTQVLEKAKTQFMKLDEAFLN